MNGEYHQDAPWRLYAAGWMVSKDGECRTNAARTSGTPGRDRSEAPLRLQSMFRVEPPAMKLIP